MSAAGALVGHVGRWWRHLPEGWKLAAELVDWTLAVVWCVRTRTLMNRLPQVPDLSDVRWDLGPAGAPGLVVVVPARDEAETLRPAMETLLAQDYPWLRVIAVDDRSTDATGGVLDELAAARPDRLAVLHLVEAAEGWTAKTYAMETAARLSRSEWLLFTEADVWFSPSVLRRALAFAEMSGADHLVVTPSAVIRGWGTSMLLGFLSVLGLWMSRPWRVADPTARWDVAGAGAFNLIRREVWEDLGGFEPQQLAVVDGLTLGRRVRAAGLRQRQVFAPGLVLVHRAKGLRVLLWSMTTRLFAAMGFQLWMAVGVCVFVSVTFVLPVLGLGWRRTWVPSLILAACVGTQYRILGEITGIEARWGWLYPLGALVWMLTLVRSVVVTFWRRGVRWRGMLYPLRELRPWNGPLTWELNAAKARAERRRTERIVRRRARRKRQ